MIVTSARRIFVGAKAFQLFREHLNQVPVNNELTIGNGVTIYLNVMLPAMSIVTDSPEIVEVLREVKQEISKGARIQ